MDGFSDIIVYFNYFGINLGSSALWTPPNLFMIAIAVFWMIIGSIQDFKRREVENWWNFSLIVFILAFRAFLSVENSEIMYFAWGVIGLIAGFLLCNAFYYGRMFAGGDAKLMMALGTVLPLSLDWRVNLGLLALFLILFLFIGALYGLGFSLILGIMNCKGFMKEYGKQLRQNKKIILAVLAIALLFGVALLLMREDILALLCFIILAAPFLIIYARAIEKCCMMKETRVSELSIGDWIVKPIKIKKGRKVIVVKPYWEGLSESELKLIQGNYRGKVLVKSGAPFVPAFLLAFIVFAYIIFKIG